MISTHTGQSVPMDTLRERGALFRYIAEGFYHVEFPAKDGVGPIAGIWFVEKSDQQDTGAAV